MTTVILFSGLVIFLVCLLIHVTIWRIRFPKRPAFMLFFVFFFLPLFAWLLYSFFVLIRVMPAGYGPSLVYGAAILLLHFSLSSAYILSYPAVEAISPTLAIALFMGKTGHEARFEELVRLFPDESILTPRIEDLVESRLIRLDNGTLSLTLGGRILVYCFIGFRSFIGLKRGKG